MKEKPDFVKDDHLIFLDRLRESGITNMFAASPYLQRRFSYLSHNEAIEAVAYWMQTFADRHPEGE